MVRWRGRRKSDNVEDRRGQSGRRPVWFPSPGGRDGRRMRIPLPRGRDGKGTGLGIAEKIRTAQQGMGGRRSNALRIRMEL